MKFSKLGLVHFAKSHEVKGSILTATVRRNPSGLYFVSILVGIDVQELPKTGLSVGIDVGWKDFAIPSDGAKHGNSKWFRKIDKEGSRRKADSIQTTRTSNEA